MAQKYDCQGVFIPTVRKAISEYANRLKEHIEEIKPQPINPHGTRNVLIFRELAASPYVFLRNDTNYTNDTNYNHLKTGHTK
jgi:hypothetical protein